MDQEKLKKKFYKRWQFWILVVVIILVIGMFSGSQPQQTVNQNSSDTNKTQETASVKETTTQNVTPKTDQEILEDGLRDNVSKASGSTDFSYKGLDVSKADSDRPESTKMLTISVYASDFWSKDSLIRDTGKLSSSLFQTAFNSNMNAYDVIVWYYGKTKDRYGNEKDSVILTYSLDKKTYQKISWSSFDSGKLCEFLQQEEKISGFGTGPACNTLVNIQ